LKAFEKRWKKATSTIACLRSSTKEAKGMRMVAEPKPVTLATAAARKAITMKSRVDSSPSIARK